MTTWLTTTQVAEKAGYCVRTIRRWIRRGRLRAIKMEDGPYAEWRVSEQDFERFVAACGAEVSA